MARAGDDLERVEVRSRAAWRQWLERHQAQPRSIWLVTFRKHHPDHVPWEDTVREALCFGWIDSLPRKVDADRTAHRMSPRSPKSAWSAVNKRLVAELEAAGLMRRPGLAAIERAKANGMWSVLDGADRGEVPDDLARALADRTGAREAWDAFPFSARRGMLAQVALAKRAGTRAARVRTIADAAARGERAMG